MIDCRIVILKKWNKYIYLLKKTIIKSIIKLYNRKDKDLGGCRMNNISSSDKKAYAEIDYILHYH